nr:unnamed protein product [Callosobruchus chinensis]
MTRREQSVCTRLRIGHTRMTSSYLFTREEPPVCFICDLQLTVQHIIAECPAYEAERWLYQISDDLIETLNTSPRRTKHFCYGYKVLASLTKYKIKHIHGNL